MKWNNTVISTIDIIIEASQTYLQMSRQIGKELSGKMRIQNALQLEMNASQCVHNGTQHCARTGHHDISR